MTTNPRIPFRMSSDRPNLPGPNGKRLIVQVVVNVENWQFDQPMPRRILTAPHGAESVPDVPNFAWAEYGMRVGMPRLFDVLKRHEVSAGCAINAGVITNYPRLAEAIVDAGWEMIGHGLHQKTITGEAAEADLIQQALDIVSGFTGKKVQGWLSPGLRETEHTPDILKAAGLRYVSDWVLDDLPNWLQTQHGPLISMPYTLEINDSPLFAIQAQPSDEMLSRVRRSVEVLEREAGADGSRILSVALHPHLIAVPHRIAALDELLAYLRARDDTVFMAGADIADWYERVEPSSMTSVSAPQTKARA